MDIILDVSVNFLIIFLIFSNICCRYTLENSNVHLQHNMAFLMNEFLTICFFKQILNHFH